MKGLLLMIEEPVECRLTIMSMVNKIQKGCNCCKAFPIMCKYVKVGRLVNKNNTRCHIAEISDMTIDNIYLCKLINIHRQILILKTSDLVVVSDFFQSTFDLVY